MKILDRIDQSVERLYAWDYSKSIAILTDRASRTIVPLALLCICLACAAYVWRQYYDYLLRKEAFEICYDWTEKLSSFNKGLAMQECFNRMKP